MTISGQPQGTGTDPIMKDLSNQSDVVKKYHEEQARKVEEVAQRLGVNVNEIYAALEGKASPELMKRITRAINEQSHRRTIPGDKEELTNEQKIVQKEPSAETVRLAQNVLEFAQQLDETTKDALQKNSSLKGRVTIGQSGKKVSGI